MCSVPVIAIDGPVASGKGAAAAGVASRLGFMCLDSGSLYRVVALLALRRGADPDDLDPVLEQLVGLDDDGWEALLTLPDLREERVSQMASRVSSIQAVRTALLPRQRALRRSPGLVAEGRDMGCIVFPDADLKVFLTADPEIRARRRAAELSARGKSVKIQDILSDLLDRDERDTLRTVAPLMCQQDARTLDNSEMDCSATVDVICKWFEDS